MKHAFLIISIIWASLLIVFTFLLQEWEYVTFFPFVMILGYSIIYALYQPKRARQACCEKVSEE